MFRLWEEAGERRPRRTKKENTAHFIVPPIQVEIALDLKKWLTIKIVNKSLKYIKIKPTEKYFFSAAYRLC